MIPKEETPSKRALWGNILDVHRCKDLQKLTNKTHQFIKKSYAMTVEFIPKMQGWFTIHRPINIIHHANENNMINQYMQRKHLIKFSPFS